MTQSLPLTNSSQFARVDDDCFDALSRYHWRCNSYGYVIRSYRSDDGHTHYICLHRQVMNARRGQYVDHINHNKLDNRRANLRFCSQSENLANRRLHRNNSSGFKGVIYQHGKWHARIQKDRRDLHLGFYPDLKTAALAYDCAAKLLYADFARLNLPDCPTPPDIKTQVLAYLARAAAKQPD